MFTYDFSRVDGVVFDFGGVISVSPLAHWELYPYCASLGLDRAAMDEAWKRYRHLWDGGFMSFDDMYRVIFADRDLPAPTPEILARLWEIDAEGWARELRADTLALMRELKAQGKRLGVLSNMSPDFHARLFVPRFGACRALLDAEVISGLEKCYKPRRRIFDLAAARMGLAPARLLFVDDTPANVEAARAYGWNAERYV